MKVTKKWLKYVLILLSLVVIGFFNQNLISTWIHSFLNAFFLFHILYFILAFFLVIVFHELSHLLAFVIKKVQIQMILLLIFVFYRKEKWHFKIEPSFIQLGGGMVVPKYGVIDNEITAKAYLDKTSFSLLFAPLMTGFYAIIMLTIMILFQTNAHLIIFGFFFVIISLFYLYTSSLSAAGIYGDFVAHKKIQKDKLLQVSILCQYSHPLSLYLVEEISHVIESYTKLNFKEEILPLLSQYYDYHIFEASEPNLFLLQKSQALLQYPNVLKRIAKNIRTSSIIEQAILYLYRNNHIQESDEMLLQYKLALNESKMDSELLKEKIHEIEFLTKIESELSDDRIDYKEDWLSKLTLYIMPSVSNNYLDKEIERFPNNDSLES